jgi:hypothetical protein
MHESAPWSLIEGEGPLLAFAIHAGHEIRFGLREILPSAKRDACAKRTPLPGSGRKSLPPASWSIARASRRT